jgi:signal peptidase I
MQVKTKLTMKSLIGNLLFAAVILLISARFLSVFSGTYFPMDIVTTDSMSPSLMAGDLIAWTPANINDVKIGDVIVFKSWLSWPDEKLIVHRVIDIKTESGKVALVTKGDANNYTDQAGPHIPEPYVIEKNFIGKSISIGPIPLKIPFIGLIGIWINDGFKLLSQPSASKGPAVSLGIFTPLILSVIIFVTSLFLLPDRAKTLEGRMRLSIFGKQTLRIRNLVVFFLSIFIVFFILIHCFAFDSVQASVGVGEFPDKSSFELGSLAPGQTGQPRELPIVNPSIFPVKGILFGTGSLASFVHRGVFSIDPGKIKEANVTATVPNGTANGTFIGQIMIYSSPVWLMFPDDFMKTLCTWNAGASVYVLDILSAVIFTFLTIVLILSCAYIGDKYRMAEINLCWHYAPKIILKKGVARRFRIARRRMKDGFVKRLSWLSEMNLAVFDPKPIIIGSILIIPLVLLLSSEILAMVVAALLGSLLVYALRGAMRRKVVMTAVVAMLVSIGYLSIKINVWLFSKSQPFVESLGLGMGAVGIYLLALAFFLVPLSLLAWYLTRSLRNLKERKDPLLVMEGRCDL